MEISLTLEAMFGLNWPLWKDLIAWAEQSGLAGLYRSDHFFIGKAGADSLELITSLTYLADHSQKIRFGPMVSPLSIHNPVELARQAMSINELSGGRMILGLGAGWHDAEHKMFGYDLGDKKTRLDRFEEGLKVITSLVRSPAPVDFTGKYFQLRQAQLIPQSPVRIMVGGNGPTRTLPLVARYADIWNSQIVDVPGFAAANQHLDDLILAAGRQPEDVKRTMMIPALCVRSPKDLERHISLIQKHAPPYQNSSTEEIGNWLYNMKGLIGSPQLVVDGLAAYGAKGAKEVIIEWFAMHDLEGLELLASEVLQKF